MVASMTGPFSFERVISAVEKVRQRLLRAAAALNAANVPYAVVGGHAVALWVSRVDEAAVRNTRDVDILIRRGDFDAARDALKKTGFIHHQVAGVDVFLDGPEAGPRDAVHLVFANEKVRPHEVMANPDVDECEVTDQFRVLSLEALVRVKLTAYRDKDRTHLRDMIETGLLDHTWPEKLPPILGERLQHLLDTPEG
jgi:hypothetical protein